MLTSNPCLHNALLPSNISPKSIPTPKPLTLSPPAALSEPHLLSQPLTSCCTTRLSSRNGCRGVERESEAQLTSKECQYGQWSGITPPPPSAQGETNRSREQAKAQVARTVGRSTSSGACFFIFLESASLDKIRIIENCNFLFCQLKIPLTLHRVSLPSPISFERLATT